MAIAFVVEDGTGLTTATSYVSVAEATDLLSLNPVMSATWVALDSAEQESYLIWASRYLDYHVQWEGYKTVETSGLRWPRSCVTDVDGLYIDTDVIPEAVKEATAQLAIFLTASDAAQSGGESSNLPEGVKRVKADVVELEFFDDAAANSRSGSDLLPVNIRFLIRGLGTIKVGRLRVGNVVR